MWVEINRAKHLVQLTWVTRQVHKTSSGASSFLSSTQSKIVNIKEKCTVIKSVKYICLENEKSERVFETNVWKPSLYKIWDDNCDAECVDESSCRFSWREVLVLMDRSLLLDGGYRWLTSCGWKGLRHCDFLSSQGIACVSDPALIKRTLGGSMWTSPRPETTCMNGSVNSAYWPERKDTAARSTKTACGHRPLPPLCTTLNTRRRCWLRDWKVRTDRRRLIKFSFKEWVVPLEDNTLVC